MVSFLNASDGIACACMSPDASTIVAGFEDSRVRVWTARPEEQFGRVSQVLVGHSGVVTGARMTSEANVLVTASSDGTARVWALVPGDAGAGNANANGDVHMSVSDGFVAATTSTTTVGGGKPKTMWTCVSVSNSAKERGVSALWDVDVAAYGSYFCTSGRDARARLWMTERPDTPVRVFQGHLSDVDCVEIHPNVTYVATGSADKTARLWDVRTGKVARVFVGHLGGVSACKVDPSGRFLATGGRDNQVCVWDLGSGKRVASLRGHDSSITSVAWSPSGEHVATGGSDCAVVVWSTGVAYQPSSGEFPPDAHVFGSSSSLGGGEAGLARSAATSSSSSSTSTSSTSAVQGKTGGPDATAESAAGTSRKFLTKFTPLVALGFTKPDVVVAMGNFTL